MLRLYIYQNERLADAVPAASATRQPPPPRQINKFCLFGGERTTTIGTPTDLGEGNRELRAIWRKLTTCVDLVKALARGQGLTDLRDMDGVVVGAPEAQVGVVGHVVV